MYHIKTNNYYLNYCLFISLLFGACVCDKNYLQVDPASLGGPTFSSNKVASYFVSPDKCSSQN